jgi:hypothetical protein
MSSPLSPVMSADSAMASGRCASDMSKASVKDAASIAAPAGSRARFSRRRRVGIRDQVTHGRLRKLVSSMQGSNSGNAPVSARTDTAP